MGAFAVIQASAESSYTLPQPRTRDTKSRKQHELLEKGHTLGRGSPTYEKYPRLTESHGKREVRKEVGGKKKVKTEVGGKKEVKTEDGGKKKNIGEICTHYFQMLMENPLELAKSDLCKRWSQFLCRMLKL